MRMNESAKYNNQNKANGLGTNAFPSDVEVPILDGGKKINSLPSRPRADEESEPPLP